MAENLNYDPGTGNSACYGNQTSNCVTYGRLYDWSTAMGFPPRCNYDNCSSLIQTKHQGICPSGWHIPSSEDWNKLTSYVKFTRYDSPMLKATTGWNASSGDVDNGTDQYGFSALPGGSGSDGSFYYAGDLGFWWVSEKNSMIMSGYYGSGMMVIGQDYSKPILNSVRCVQD